MAGAPTVQALPDAYKRCSSLGLEPTETPPQREVTMPESSNRKVRVYLIDDHPIVREGFARALGDASDIVVVGQADTAAEALKEAPFTSPDVILVDLNMPDRDGIELIGA